ncbi:ferrous iron transport protein B (plasmid) [Legionella adelaidensis]|uniref:Ferrous iron transport protein B n=1 Tax=Legionella adelaidensis TaxID=45056 RepID=A0A0W0R5U3_9GAMM|nr:Fe(2+) transporter permease subunit FeoB [Legionella adelaidensis]KTC66468.1 ferrous iron transport protein B [Legionella adelaidensis]VEH86244.1 ferrous iron transport protein B [Legionella adelaidensis]
MTKVVLVGNPNCGKTSLFNILTGDNQKVGNWPGVTVEKKSGSLQLAQQKVDITDLPGIYSLVSSSEGASQDEIIAANFIAFGEADLIINVIDACHLERHLYLTSQLLELGKPIVIALNMMDLAKQRDISINVEALSHILHCPVVAIQAHRGMGIGELKKSLLAPQRPIPLSLKIPAEIYQNLNQLEEKINQAGLSKKLSAYIANRIAEGDTLLAQKLPKMEEEHWPIDTDILLADARYQAVHNIVIRTQEKKSDASDYLTARIDRVVLNRFWSLPIFFAVMYAMFLFAINIGGAFQDFFSISSDVIFVQGAEYLLTNLHAPGWLIALVAHGIGKGINTTVSFIPVIAAMFFFLSLLESSGYMARAAFIVDKAMRALGLPGKSFVPMIVGFGCNVPAIIGARILDCERDRILTVLMSPFMSCSARLAIYAVFVTAFFPQGGQNIVFCLYFIGIVMAVLTGLLLRKTVFKGKAAPLILELPAYHKPTWNRLFKDTYNRLRYFIIRAGKLIIPVCLILGFLNALTLDGLTHGLEASPDSILSKLGQFLTPLFHPMGITNENWPATVGLLTGTLAKEVVVGSLNSLYSQIGNVHQVFSQSFDFGDLMFGAIRTIPANLSNLGAALIHPISANVPADGLSRPAFGIMFHYFNNKAAAFAYLLFILLYIPCVSTMAAIKQETQQKWMWFSIIWSLLIAYTSAVLFYQLATCLSHPFYSLLWIATLIGLLFSSITLFFRLTKSRRRILACS